MYEFDSQEEAFNMLFDKDKFEKILYNLISNAFKFTPDYGHISVSLRTKREKEQTLFEIVISDSGIGISNHDKEHIFELFYKGSSQSFEQVHGTGVGLVLVKDYVHMHSGKISVDSEQGRGTIFSITIPCTHDLTGAPAPIDAQQTDERQHQDDDTSEKPRCKVLIVEDNQDMQTFLKINLEDEYEIITANDGQQGLNAIKSTYPDLVISDIMMPEIDGLELCNSVKSDPTISYIPIILLTAKGAEQDRTEGYACGADGYISKPFNMKTLKARISAIIESRLKLQEHYKQQIMTDPANITIESENDKFVSWLVDAIEQNMDNSDFGIQDLCNISGYSYQQIYRKVKALTGQTINEFIRAFRLKRASQYLSQSDMRVSEVMYTVGFNSHSYFTKCFREYFGMSPKEYADKMRGQNS